MIKCKKCGYESEYTGNPCQVCGSDVMPDAYDAENARRELERALKEKNAQKVKALHHLLAEFSTHYDILIHIWRESLSILILSQINAS